MIAEGTVLYPQDISPNEMYYDNEPYAYWLSVPEYNVFDILPRLKSREYVKETNALIMKAIGDTMRVVAFSQTDEYWEEVVKKYEILKFNKTN